MTRFLTNCIRKSSKPKDLNTYDVQIAATYPVQSNINSIPVINPTEWCDPPIDEFVKENSVKDDSISLRLQNDKDYKIQCEQNMVKKGESNKIDDDVKWECDLVSDHSNGDENEMQENYNYGDMV